MPTPLDLAAARRLAPALGDLGERLVRGGLIERSVIAFYGLPQVWDARYRPPPRERSRRGLGGLIALFVAGEAVPRAHLPLLGDGDLAVLGTVGLCATDGDHLIPRCSITPFQGALVIADRLDDRAAEAVLAPDLSAWNTAASLPARLPTLLDVGCGAGAIALAAARRGARVTGTDLDPRALAFAELGALLNRAPLTLAEGDLFAGIDGGFAAVVWNAPLLRAPLAGQEASPLYLHTVDAEAQVVRFLDGAPSRLEPGGEILCHAQLSPAVEAAIARSPLPGRLRLHFATAVDGTAHGLSWLHPGAIDAGRRRVALGPACPHLRRELLDRLAATAELLAAGGETLLRAALRPAPWLTLHRDLVHDGHAFRPREARLGDHRLDDDELALLERCDGHPFGALALDEATEERLLDLGRRGLLVA